MNEPTEIDYFTDDIDPEATAAPATLERLVELAKQATDVTKEIGVASTALAEKQGKLENIERNLIPGVMQELGMTSFMLEDGNTVAITEVLNTSITEANKPAAYKWLEDRGDDGIIKTNVHVGFGKGEMDDAKKALTALSEAGYAAEMDRSVHASTLKSYVKEQLEKGTNVPADVFGIYQYKRAKITPPKAPKAPKARK